MALEPPIATRKPDSAAAECRGPSRYAPIGKRELLVAWGLLALLALPVFFTHIAQGGLYLDDWVNVANAVHPPHGGLWTTISEQTLATSRPGLAAFLSVHCFLLGTHVKALLITTAALAVLAAALLYAVLRLLNVPWYHAWLLSALTLVYPWYDSTRLWDAASPIDLAIVLALAGLWVALVGLSRNSWRLHAGAAILYLLSMLTYEIALPLIALAGLLYVFRSGWRAARLRWGVDLATVLVVAYWYHAKTPKTVSSLSGDLEHLREIFMRSGPLVARTLYPFGLHARTSVVLAILAVVFALGTAIYLRRGRSRIASAEWGLRNWLLLGIGGLLVAALGWAIFIPADPYYSPSIFGVTNRVNGLAGFGLIFLIYAGFGVLGSIVGDKVRGRPWLPTAITLSLGLMLGAAYAHVFERHSRLWNDAYAYEIRAADSVHAALPHLPHEAAVVTTGYPVNVTLGVPIFTTTWDLAGMIHLTYGDQTLRAYPLTEVLTLECKSRGLRVSEEGVPITPYGLAWLLDLGTGETSRPRSRSECLAAKERFPPGPQFLQTAY